MEFFVPTVTDAALALVHAELDTLIRGNHQRTAKQLALARLKGKGTYERRGNELRRLADEKYPPKPR